LIVLDTNVVLDLWLFEDFRVAGLRAALETGHAQALVTAATLAELADVLQRPFAMSRKDNVSRVLAALHACSHRVPTPAPQSIRAPRCSDVDDQKFVDLAWSWPAGWLLSRDRAVLKLARTARLHGLRIGTPETWAAAQA